MTFFIDVSRDMQMHKETGEIAAIPVIVRTEEDTYVETAFHEETRRDKYLSDIPNPEEYIEENTDRIYDAVVVHNPFEGGSKRVVKAADVGLEELVWWTEDIETITPDEAIGEESGDSEEYEEVEQGD